LDPSDPHNAFAELSGIVLGEQPLAQVLQRVAELAQHAIPGAGAVSVTLLESDQARSVAFTGDLAAALDERQYELGFGPCMDAARTGSTIFLDYTSNQEKYPDFVRQARRHGVVHSVSIGLPVAERIIGALNVYGMDQEDAPFDEDALAIARAFSHYAAVALANAALFSSTAELADHMQQALDSRAVIDQAKGIIMAKRGCNADEAFDHLVKLASTQHLKLRQVAEQLVQQAGGRG
jgi:GAF domain-containing protein